MIILKHEMKMSLKTLMIWSMSVAIMILVFILMFPGLKDSMSDMANKFSSMGGFSDAFGLDKLNIGTIMGFYGTEIGTVFAICGSMFAAIIAGSALSKEEEGHTAEFLFTLPCSRKSVVLQKGIAVICNILIFNAICIVISLISFKIIGEDILYKEFFSYHLTQLIMQFEIGAVTFAISSFQKNTSVGLGIGFALILYFLDMIIRIIPNTEILKYFTPFYYANAADILSGGKLHLNLIFLGIFVTFLMITIAFSKYTTKDLKS
ncbi:ABC transporter permease subunit [Clostridium ihumii]|uniref:ABC transporter permease subunit n=1 Tax=Clostridium ihumii TaxID=1470356 RepID=UPI003D32E5B9